MLGPRRPGARRHSTGTHGRLCTGKPQLGLEGLKLLPEPSVSPRFPVAAWGTKKHHGLRLGDVDGKMRAVQGWVSLSSATGERMANGGCQPRHTGSSPCGKKRALYQMWPEATVRPKAAQACWTGR